MRLRFFLWASADFGVRRSKVEISFCRSGYILVLRDDSSRLFCAAIRFPGGSTARVSNLTLLLEVELQSKLHQTWVARLLNQAKRGIAEVAVWVDELRFVEQVEDVGAELEIFRLVESNPLRDGDIPLVLARPATDRAWSGGELTERRIAEL